MIDAMLLVRITPAVEKEPCPNVETRLCYAGSTLLIAGETEPTIAAGQLGAVLGGQGHGLGRDHSPPS